MSDAEPFTDDSLRRNASDEDEENRKNPLKKPKNREMLQRLVTQDRNNSEEEMEEVTDDEEAEEVDSSVTDLSSRTSSIDLGHASRLREHFRGHRGHYGVRGGGGGQHTSFVNVTQIGTLNGDLVLGPKLTAHAHSAQQPAHAQRGSKMPSTQRPTKHEDSHRRECGRSRRTLEARELDALGRKIENWRGVGELLKLDSVTLSAIDNDVAQLDQKVRCMLHRWSEWRDEDANVGRLAAALYRTDEWTAISALRP